MLRRVSAEMQRQWRPCSRSDADQLTSSGEWRRGRDELVRGTLASSKTNSGARTITIQTVRFPAADVAIADGEYVIGATSSAQARNMWTSFVMIRSGGRWRIDAIRNMLPGAAGTLTADANPCQERRQ